MDKNTYEIRFCELISASLGLTALRAEGCGIAAFGGDEYIVSVTGLVFVSSVLHDKEAAEDRGVDFEKGFRGCGIALRTMSIKSALRASLPAGHSHSERRRRIPVRIAYEKNIGTYRLAGRSSFAAGRCADVPMKQLPVFKIKKPAPKGQAFMMPF
ncbi:hypothetical protein [uncultured Dialister sp.]|uniref:hypothetical protein n=1 Tax=uncultured Dialister sp. TaxID=278064 RepID=UPI0026DB6E7F|nr:hypothetical protein [uncultured Dialister sp.]